jgi:hypothetical protein
LKRSRHEQNSDAQPSLPQPVHGLRKLVPARHQPQYPVYRWRETPADQAGAYWLLDEIAIIQPHDKRVAAEEFQVWKLVVRSDRTATLTCDNGDGKIVFTKEIEYTDFPLEEISLWFANNVIYLPSEYSSGRCPRRSCLSAGCSFSVTASRRIKDEYDSLSDVADP